MDYKIIHGDGVFELNMLYFGAKVSMIFADPPDNIGLKYDGGHNDNMPEAEYKNWLNKLALHMGELAAFSDITSWLSFNARYISTATGMADIYKVGFPNRDAVPLISERLIMWYFTFGQHCDSDCGNNYRPIVRYAPANKIWNTDAIRIPSARQKMGDKRANPAGRVPGDVWGGPADIAGLCRVQGNNKERRAWHPTQHPEALLERAILMSTNEGDLVFDPFMGTGTTLRVCQRLNRRCITCDTSEVYCEKVSAETSVQIFKQDSL